jgi:hypothetical protein
MFSDGWSGFGCLGSAAGVDAGGWLGLVDIATWEGLAWCCSGGDSDVQCGQALGGVDEGMSVVCVLGFGIGSSGGRGVTTSVWVSLPSQVSWCVGLRGVRVGKGIASLLGLSIEQRTRHRLDVGLGELGGVSTNNEEDEDGELHSVHLYVSAEFILFYLVYRSWMDLKGSSALEKFLIFIHGCSWFWVQQEFIPSAF